MPYKAYIGQVKNPEKSKVDEKYNYDSDSVHERKPSSTSDSGFESTKAGAAPPPPTKPKDVNVKSLRARSRSEPRQSLKYYNFDFQVFFVKNLDFLFQKKVLKILTKSFNKIWLKFFD